MCGKDYESTPIVIGCTNCNERGCHLCEEGYFRLSCCPRELIGFELAEAINLAAMCGNGDWPVDGGLLSQSAWFVELKRHLESEQGRIEAEKLDGNVRKQ